MAIVPAGLVSQEQIRELALALPQALEQDHHGRPSFRVGGRIFATLWDPEHMNVMLDEPGIHTAVHDNPGVCEEFWWGEQLRAVQVDLARAEAALAAELLAGGWEQKAPERLLNDWLARQANVSTRILRLAGSFTWAMMTRTRGSKWVAGRGVTIG